MMLKVRSPVDGQVGQLLVQQRANVAANVADRSRVVDLSALEARAAGARSVRARPRDRHAGGNPGRQRQVHRRAVSASRPKSSKARSPRACASATDKPAGLRQNQRLTTRILIDEHPNVLMVERGPFVDTGAGRVAYVVRDGVAERTPIQVGATSLNCRRDRLAASRKATAS